MIYKTSCAISGNKIFDDDFNLVTKNREQTFITNCCKELRKKGRTICFNYWQVEELQKKFDYKLKVKNNGWYYNINLFINKREEK